VRPHIEFAVPAWSPWLEADKEVLEKVQRRAVQMVSGLKAHTYEKVLTGARYSLMRSNPSPPMRSCTKWKKLFHILRPLYYDTGFNEFQARRPGFKNTLGDDSCCLLKVLDRKVGTVGTDRGRNAGNHKKLLKKNLL
jgi:hypothetical protein